MREILSTKDHRLIQIIEILVSSDWISLGDLASELACSEKTVRNDLNTLTSHYSDIKIETSNALGYRLIKEGKNPADDVINDALIAQIVALLLKSSNLRSADIEDILYVTANSIRGAINQFNAFFDKNSNVAIQNRPFQLTGDELTISSLLLVRSFESYFKKSLDYRLEFDILEELIDRLFVENSQLKAAFHDNRPVLNLVLYIRFYREFNQHPLPKNSSYQFQEYQFLEDKHFRDNFFSVFSFPIDNTVLNAVVNFALFEPATVSYLRMSYLFPTQRESARLRRTVRKLMTNISEKFKLPVLNAQELTALLQPQPLPKTKLSLNYEQHEFLMQILHYELECHLTSETPFQLRALYELFVIPELSAILSSEWVALKEVFNEIDLTMVVGFDVVASQQHYTLIQHFFNYHKDHRIVIKELVDQPQRLDFDVLITNLKNPRTASVPIIHLGNLPNNEYSEKLQTLYTLFKLDQYLTYS
ncbi:helix-turn-helix domain-containing protein [Vagococcus salmoninarum]|uniref:helix-turn-helix domain-containing protein n=1 Tax=Vagococcus salmoninarum TaxID=2739 RepID=UPI0028D1B2C4|nr:helix-turn-helix domain-containing protein [Vagococcus salmoninarum]